MKSYRDLIVWQKSVDMVTLIYNLVGFTDANRLVEINELSFEIEKMLNSLISKINSNIN